MQELVTPASSNAPSAPGDSAVGISVRPQPCSGFSDNSVKRTCARLRASRELKYRRSTPPLRCRTGSAACVPTHSECRSGSNTSPRLTHCISEIDLVAALVERLGTGPDINGPRRGVLHHHRAGANQRVVADGDGVAQRGIHADEAVPLDVDVSRHDDVGADETMIVHGGVVADVVAARRRYVVPDLDQR